MPEKQRKRVLVEVVLEESLIDFFFPPKKKKEKKKLCSRVSSSFRTSFRLWLLIASCESFSYRLLLSTPSPLPLYPFHHHSSTMREVISLHIGQAGTCGVSRKGGGAREKRREKKRKMQVKAMRAATREEALGLLSFLSSFGVAASCPSSGPLASFSASRPGA